MYVSITRGPRGAELAKGAWGRFLGPATHDLCLSVARVLYGGGIRADWATRSRRAQAARHRAHRVASRPAHTASVRPSPRRRDGGGPAPAARRFAPRPDARTAPAAQDATGRPRRCRCPSPGEAHCHLCARSGACCSSLRSSPRAHRPRLRRKTRRGRPAPAARRCAPRPPGRARRARDHTSGQGVRRRRRWQPRAWADAL